MKFLDFPRIPVALTTVICALFFLMSCGESEPGQTQENQNQCAQVCTIGDTQCDGNGIQLCANVDGCPGWTQITTCPTGEICEAGVCVDACAVDCEVGTSRCAGSGVEYCVLAAGCPDWSQPISCSADESCSDGRCRTECDDQCTLGERECHEGGTRFCQYDAGGCLQWSETTSCDSGQTCDDGVCASDCTDQCSTDGQRRCSTSAGFEICQETAQGCLDWSAPIECAGDLICTGGHCASECSDVCTEADTTCSGSGGYLVCEMQASGCTDWSPGASCQANEVCENGQCNLACQDSCAGGDAQCSGSDGLQFCQYQTNGCYDWGDALLCPAGLACDGGQCVYDCTDECTAGATQCDGDGVQLCHTQSNGCTVWTAPTACSGDLSCQNGSCVASCTDQCSIQGETECVGEFGVQLCQQQSNGCLDWSGPFTCPSGFECQAGECTSLPADACSPTNTTGDCPSGEFCDDGQCIPLECSAANPVGSCPPGQTCDGGTCVVDPICNCTANEICLDGQCYPDVETCSSTNPTGLCQSGFDCIQGSCISSDNECSSVNPSGICPIGQWCDDGTCQIIDDEPLCNDGNSCTDNWFNYNSNLCESQPSNNSCTDGNGCTTNWCEDGQCMSAPVSGCTEPPVINPWTSPTNQGTVILTGSKDSGSAIEINGSTAVSENPDADWSVGPLNLSPGENVFIVRSVDGGVQSEAQEVVIYYDNVAPVTSITPDGGTFLNGLTVQVTTNEPATVFYTTDGSTPDSSSQSFDSIRQFRVFEPTTLRFLARDRAGNWEAQVVEANFDVTSYGNRWNPGPQLSGPLVDAGVVAVDDYVYIAGGYSGTSSQAGAHRFDLIDEQWSTIPSLPNGRSELAMVARNGVLFAIGGQDEGTALNSLLMIEPDLDTSWTNRQGMPTTRYGLAAVALGDEIFAFGGKSSGGTVRDTVEVYDVITNSWSNQVAQMPRPRYAFEALEVNGQIYLLGGEDQNGDPIAEVDVYNRANDTWSQVASLPTPRSSVSAGVIQNIGTIVGGFEVYIVVAGGFDAQGNPSSVVEEYRLDTDTWRTRTPLGEARTGAAAVTLDVPDDFSFYQRQVWLVGGEVAGTASDEITIYTHNLGFARHLSPLPEARFEHAAAVLNDRFYLFAGRHEGNHQSGWSFNPETETYAPLPDLPSVQNGLAAASLGGRVYAIGGTNQFGNPLSLVHAYDPVAATWEQVSSDLSPRRDAAVAVHGDDIYIIGGYNNGAVQTVEIYNPRENSWRSGPVLPQARTGAMAVVHAGDIYVLGGLNSSGTPVTSILRLPSGGSTWQTVSGVSLNAAFGTAQRIGEDTIAVIGGRFAGNITGRIWFYDIASGQTSTMNDALELDRSASVYYHGRVYLFGGNSSHAPGPAGESIVQKLDLHGCAPGTTNLRGDVGCVSGDFHVADYASGLGSTSSFNWRGYRFRVSRITAVTALYGGASTSGFYVALYEANGNTPTSLLASSAVPATRRARMPVPFLYLYPGTDYIIAQGRASGSGNHLTVGPISSVTSHELISVWNPTTPSDALLWGSGGDVNFIIGQSSTGTTQVRPDIGFEYQ